MIRLMITYPAARDEMDELGYPVKGTSVVIEIDPMDVPGARDSVDGAMRLGDKLRAHPLTERVRRQDDRVRVWARWPAPGGEDAPR